MCVASTAKRRRKIMKLDTRYKKRGTKDATFVKNAPKSRKK